MTSPIVFMDTETTGLSLTDDIWEFAAIRREPNGVEGELHLFIEHDAAKCAQLPESFRNDHEARFTDGWSARAAATLIAEFTAGAHVVGAVPNFDTERLAILLRRFGNEPTWHYHLIDVENLAVGWLAAEAQRLRRSVEHGYALRIQELITPPWKSDDLSRAVGIEPPGEGERHTAMGDACWARALYDAITGGSL